ncbi:MAG: LysM peptidoglycan-binding domain-containing protein [Bacteroidetes bacterium]|nr:LysM peptidoglycan-binding domain-containing protein [Bacteroidota bacterium]
MIERLRRFCVVFRFTTPVFAAFFFLGGSFVYAQRTHTTDTATYVIQEGDTLYELAMRLDTSVELLEEMNERIGGVFRPGEEILIPASKTSTSYVVRRGDTLLGISRSFGVSVAEIQGANNMSGTGLRAGTSLVIPGQGVRMEVSLDKIGIETIMEGFAVVYPEIFENRLMSSGDVYDPFRYTISHPNFPIGSIVWIREMDSGRETFAEVADRGFSEQPLLIDVSLAVARHLSIEASQETRVQIRLIYGAD